ncbi:hypothetical protein [Marinilabilia salmonicolor]|uniref:hypothetical protein n=1 Tax=Marinilabilia salmonicolor TaxID=989 RepID=UPI000299FAB6|nr:hypothetical protein [Marinilabilia salmonicolor]
MKTVTLILSLLVTLLFSSCSTYQYVGLTPLKTDASDDVGVSLTDSLEISYSFDGDGGEIQVEIFNRSLRPVLVDKSKSSLIRAGETIPFFDNTSQISSVSHSRQSYVYDRDYYTTTQGEIQTNPSILFIPPDSKVRVKGPVLERSFFDFPDTKPVEKVNLRTDNGYYKTRTVSFSGEESPATYRLFLTIIPYGKEQEPVFVSQQFSVKKLTNTSLTPGYFTNEGENNFYIKEPNGFGAFMGGIAAMALVVVLVVAGGA